MVFINKFLRLLENKREKYEFIPTVSYGSAICSGEDILTVKDRADRDMYMFKKERKEKNGLHLIKRKIIKFYNR